MAWEFHEPCVWWAQERGRQRAWKRKQSSLAVTGSPLGPFASFTKVGMWYLCLFSVYVVSLLQHWGFGCHRHLDLYTNLRKVFLKRIGTRRCLPIFLRIAVFGFLHHHHERVLVSRLTLHGWYVGSLGLQHATMQWLWLALASNVFFIFD